MDSNACAASHANKVGASIGELQHKQFGAQRNLRRATRSSAAEDDNVQSSQEVHVFWISNWMARDALLYLILPGIFGKAN